MILRNSSSSAPAPRRDEIKCLDLHGGSSATIDFFTHDDRVYAFPYHHLIHYSLDANPELNRDRNAPPDRVTFAFSSHDIVMLGWRLRGLFEHFHNTSITSIRAFDARYANLGDVMPFITEIVVTPAKGV